MPDASPSTSPATGPTDPGPADGRVAASGGIALSWASEADCADCALRMAAVPQMRQAHIALHGNLGAGKTTWVRHLLRALGVTGRIKSPSYTIVEPYELPAPPSGEPGATSPAWHFDFYRFADPQEWEDAGLRDIFASPGLKLVEWPERAAGLLPGADLDLTLTLLPDGIARSVQVDARTPLGQAVLRALT